MASQPRSVEFVVRPKEDLYLEGKLRRIKRVSANEVYPCQMQKNQNFSCLFRHYAKHNGLRKEDLVFHFVSELQPDHTPESVHLMAQDEIWVEHRKTDINHKELDEFSLPKEKEYKKCFKDLLLTSLYSDFILLDINNKKYNVHRSILSSRSSYFKALLRPGGMKESLQNEIQINYQGNIIEKMLEYIYTDTIDNIDLIDLDSLVSLFFLSNEYLLDGLKLKCEWQLLNHLSITTIGRFCQLCIMIPTDILQTNCMDFILKNRKKLKSSENFLPQISEFPEAMQFIIFALLGRSNNNDKDYDDEDDDDDDEMKRKLPRLSSDSDSSLNLSIQMNAPTQEDNLPPATPGTLSSSLTTSNTTSSSNSESNSTSSSSTSNSDESSSNPNSTFAPLITQTQSE